MNRPITFLMLDGGANQGSGDLHPRPEGVTYTHPTRASAIHTFGGAYVDDFGAGIVEIVINGNTGWHNPGAAQSGEAAIKGLRDLLSIDYHSRRRSKADAGSDPDSVELHLIDTLNDAHYLCYPLQFQLQRSKASPLLFKYSTRLLGLDRLA
jgi:hypothetical protein